MFLLHIPFRVSNSSNFRDNTYYNHLCWLTGSLTKLVYFSRNNDSRRDDDEQRCQNESLGVSNSNTSQPVLDGRLHFAKFETSKINDCLDIINFWQSLSDIKEVCF